MAKTRKIKDFAVDNSEIKEIVKELKKYASKDVVKAVSKFHRELAKEQLADIRPLARKQPVPMARQSAMGFTASGTRTEAKRNGVTEDYDTWIGLVEELDVTGSSDNLKA